MRKNARVIEISGFTGLILLLFSIVCLFVGFVMFPGYVAMYLWNKAAATISGFPVINIFQGVLLWIIIALGIYLSHGAKSPIAFKSASQLNEREIIDLMSKIKERAASKKIQTMVIDENNEIKTIETFDEENSIQNNKKENLWKRFY